MHKKILMVVALLVTTSSALFAHSSLINPCQAEIAYKAIADTIYPEDKRIVTSAIKPVHQHFIMLIKSKAGYSSIKYLTRDVVVADDRITVIQKLYNGVYTNTDSVIVSRKTLRPEYSFSDINTSKDSFVYRGNRVTGTMLAKTQKAKVTTVDTLFAKQPFNGLIYAETYQSLVYKKGRLFYIAEYVPGHQTKLTQVDYIKDDKLKICGVVIGVKVIRVVVGKLEFYYWLSKKDQEILKITGQFPGFEYRLLRIADI